MELSCGLQERQALTLREKQWMMEMLKIDGKKKSINQQPNNKLETVAALMLVT